jgi:hypothetical protein
LPEQDLTSQSVGSSSGSSLLSGSNAGISVNNGVGSSGSSTSRGASELVEEGDDGEIVASKNNLGSSLSASASYVLNAELDVSNKI